MKHLVYQTPTEGGREQGSRVEKERRGRENETLFPPQIFTQFYSREEAFWQSVLRLGKKKNDHNKERALSSAKTTVHSCQEAVI